jgi:hypothetical protein
MSNEKTRQRLMALRGWFACHFPVGTTHHNFKHSDIVYASAGALKSGIETIDEWLKELELKTKPSKKTRKL